MSVLLAVVEAGSLSAGARRLGLPLTTVSRKVSDLEAHLRTRLLSPRYFAGRGKPRRPQELAAHDCITFQGLSSPETWTFRKGKSEVTVAIHSRLTVNTAEAAIDAAQAGAGVTRVLSYQIAQARQAGAIATALEDFEPPPWPVSLVYPGQGRLPVKLRAFLDFAAPRLKARLTQ